MFFLSVCSSKEEKYLVDLRTAFLDWDILVLVLSSLLYKFHCISFLPFCHMLDSIILVVLHNIMQYFSSWF